jgi:hypothetical protein
VSAEFDCLPDPNIFYSYKYGPRNPPKSKFDIGSSMANSLYLARLFAFALFVLSFVSAQTTTCTTTDNDVDEITVIYVEEVCACGSGIPSEGAVN